jgi:DNA-binding GntR family transcriptional regulator
MSDFKIGGTVRARAARELRDRILTGRLQSGTRLDLDEITTEFGTSRTPVREALLELAYEGLVTIVPRSGITVVGMTPEHVVDNFAILAALSGKAAEWTTARVGPDQLAELVRLAERIVDAEDIVAANWRFHRGVNRACGSPPLLTYLRQAVRVVPASYFALLADQEQRSIDEHAALLDAMARGDAAAARTIAEAHVLAAGEALGDWLRNRHALAGPQ